MSVQEVYRPRFYRYAVREEPCGKGKSCWAAWLVDLPDCRTQGASADEAVARLQDLQPVYFATLANLGVKVPEPADAWGKFTSATTSTYSSARKLPKLMSAV